MKFNISITELKISCPNEVKSKFTDGKHSPHIAHVTLHCTIHNVILIVFILLSMQAVFIIYTLQRPLHTAAPNTHCSPHYTLQCQLHTAAPITHCSTTIHYSAHYTVHTEAPTIHCSTHYTLQRPLHTAASIKHFSAHYTLQRPLNSAAPLHTTAPTKHWILSVHCSLYNWPVFSTHCNLHTELIAISQIYELPTSLHWW